MTERCRSQPVSYLRLERHLQRDLSPLDRLRVSWHLQRCPVCRDCFAALSGEVMALRALPRPLRAPSRPKLPPVGSSFLWATAAAAAAALMLWLRPAPEAPPRRPARVAIKGGELALALTREHRGQLAREATRFEPADRFQALVSCPPSDPWHWQLLVRQADETYFPLIPAEPLTCANAVTLPGAFSLDGAANVQVCVVLSRDRIDSEQLKQAPLPAESACVELTPAAR